MCRRNAVVYFRCDRLRYLTLWAKTNDDQASALFGSATNASILACFPMDFLLISIGWIDEFHYHSDPVVGDVPCLRLQRDPVRRRAKTMPRQLVARTLHC